MDSEELTQEFAKAALGEDYESGCQYFLHTTESGFIIDRFNPAKDERTVFPLKEDTDDDYSATAEEYVDTPLSEASINILQKLLWKLMLYPWQITAVMAVMATLVVVLILRKAGG